MRRRANRCEVVYGPDAGLVYVLAVIVRGRRLAKDDKPRTCWQSDTGQTMPGQAFGMPSLSNEPQFREDRLFPISACTRSCQRNTNGDVPTLNCPTAPCRGRH